MHAQVTGPGSVIHSGAAERRDASTRDRVGAGITRPESPELFSPPNADSGILWTIGGVSLMVTLQRVSREMESGKKFEELFDGVIAGMLMYAGLGYIRKIHNGPNQSGGKT